MNGGNARLNMLPGPSHNHLAPYKQGLTAIDYAEKYHIPTMFYDTEDISSKIILFLASVILPLFAVLVPLASVRSWSSPILLRKQSELTMALYTCKESLPKLLIDVQECAPAIEATRSGTSYEFAVRSEREEEIEDSESKPQYC